MENKNKKIWLANDARQHLLKRAEEAYGKELEAIYDYINKMIDYAIQDYKYEVTVSLEDISKKFNCFNDKTLQLTLYYLIERKFLSRHFKVSCSYYNINPKSLFVHIKW